MPTRMICAALLAVALLPVGSLAAAEPAAGEPAKQPNSVERRLLKTDLNSLFDQYKKVRTDLDTLRFQFAQAGAGLVTLPDKDAELQAKQRMFLEKQLDELRARILWMGEALDRMKKPKRKDKNTVKR